MVVNSVTMVTTSSHTVVAVGYKRTVTSCSILVYYLYNYSMVCVLLSHGHHVTLSCDII